MKRQVKKLLGSSAVAIALTGPAFAQSSASVDAPIRLAEAGAPTVVSSLVVTARKERHVKEFKSDQTIKVLDQDQIRAVSVVGGAAKALALAPGVSTSSYGGTGAQKTTISIDGVKVGWAGFSGGNPDNGAIGVTFDGVPMNNPGNGLWQSTLVPQTSMIQTIGATYGPGSAVDRWFTNIGGGLSFTPLQPTAEAGGEIAATYGYFNTQNLSFDLQTGDIHGWRTVIAGGANRADNYMLAPDGFKNQSNDYAFYFKTRKTFAGGDFSLGAYAARSAAFRPLATPVTPIVQPDGSTPVTIAGYQPGFQQTAPLFSQQTTGFYSTLPKAVNNKFDTNAIRIVYANINIALGDGVTLHSLTYGSYENRLHWTNLHDYVLGSETSQETNQPSSTVGGEKLYADFVLPLNVVTAGGYIQFSHYHSQEQLYNPSLGFINSPIPVPAGLVASASAPNGPYTGDTFDQLDSALFVQDVFRPIPSVRITPGLRFVTYLTDFRPTEAQQFPNAVLYNPGGQNSQFPAASKTFMRLEPSVGINWNAFDWLALYGNYERSYKQPENGGGTGPFVALPASAVQLERGDYFQLGFKMRRSQLGPASDLSLDVGFSELDYNNETIPTALASGGHLLAFGSSVYRAMTVFAEASPLPKIYTFLNLGLVSAHFTSYVNGAGAFTNVPIAYTPDANFNIGAYYRGVIGSWTVTPRLSYQYTGSQFLYDDSLNITSNTKLPSFGVMNMSVEISLPTTNHMSFVKVTTLIFEADNLLDNAYNAFEYISAGGLYGSGGYTNPTTVGQGAVLALPAPPRAVYATLAVKF